MTLTSERIAEIEKADWPHASPGYRTVDQSDLTELCALAKSALSTSRVKALEWYPTGTGHWHARGLYSSWQVGPFQGKLSYTGNGASYSKDRLFDSVDEAKAAAQADYEARLLSTHEPAPATVTEVLRAETTAEHLARDMVRGVCQARRHGRAPQALVELVLVSREPCP